MLSYCRDTALQGA